MHFARENGVAIDLKKMILIFLLQVWRFYINSFYWYRQLKNGLQHLKEN